jgi:hypothetical protein
MRGAVILLALITVLAPGAASQPAARHTLTKHFTPADRVSGRYQYVPFDVPTGATTLTIAYEYDRADGANVVDLGLFEPGSLDLGTRAFRGYSGGAKSAVTITAEGATPGYIAGPLPAGRWHALLGLYRVAPAGVDVTITIGIDTTPGQPRTTAPAERLSTPAATSGSSPAPRWYKGALHTHTIHSDGTVTPAQLLQRFRDAAFDFVAITDHNTTTHASDAALHTSASPLWIIGEEVTTPAGHASVWGLGSGDWIDFRVSKGDPRIRDLVAAARQRGAIFSINHPASECLGCGWEHDVVEGIDGIEVSNGRHGEVDAALARWDALLQMGRRITGVGTSDWHSAPSPIDVAHSRVYAQALTQQSILDAIRAGRVMVMLGGNVLPPDIVVRHGELQAGLGESIAIGQPGDASVHIKAPSLAHGRVVSVSNGRRTAPERLDAKGELRTSVPARAGYVRFELFDADNVLTVITNPVYFERR